MLLFLGSYVLNLKHIEISTELHIFHLSYRNVLYLCSVFRILRLG